jgi:microcompartment protein CcmL/EutN
MLEGWLNWRWLMRRASGPPERIETGTVSSGIVAADLAAKAAGARLVELLLARGIGGKTVVLLTGCVADVEAAVEAGAEAAGLRRALVSRRVIASAHPEFTAVLERRWQALR